MRVCIDIGGTSIKYGIGYEEKGEFKLIHRNEIPTQAKQLGGEGIENKIMEVIDELKQKESIDGVAISTAGIVDFNTGTIVYANDNIPNYTGRNLRRLISDRMNLPCIVENDVNSAAMGEATYGIARGAKSIICITVGTGVGGAIVLNGEIWHGQNNSAGEIGYLPIDDGTLESNGSTTAIIREVEAKTGKLLNGKQIFEKAISGDRCCVRAIKHMCSGLALGIASGILLLNPEMIVLGGGIMGQKDYLRPMIYDEVKRYVKKDILNDCRIEFAQLGNDAGMAGAFALFAKVRGT